MSQKNVAHLKSCEIQRMRPIFKTEILICQSKAILDENILLGKITHLWDPEISKMLARCLLGTKIPQSILVGHLFPIDVNFFSEIDNVNFKHKS